MVSHSRPQVNLSTGGSSGVPLSRLSSGGSISSVATAAPADDPVSAYDAFLAEFLTPVADAGSRIGGEVRTSRARALQCMAGPALKAQHRMHVA